MYYFIDRASGFIILAIFLCVMPTLSLATNGYFAHGTGIKTRALAGAGVAFPQDAMASATNPAGMAFVGNQYDFGAVLFHPDRGYSSSSSLANGNGGAFTIGPASQDSGDDFFIIPSFGINKMLTDNDSIGLSVYGNGGLNTTYRSSGGSANFDPDGPGPATATTFPGLFGGGTAGIDLMQLFVNFSYAHKFNENLSIGISPIFAVQSLRINGLSTFAPFTKTFNASGGTQAPTNLTENGASYSYGGGYQLGIYAKDIVGGGFDLGLSYRSKMWMDEFDDYADLLADDGDFDVPATLWVGLAKNLTENVTLVFDYQKIWYDDVDSIGNDFARFLDCPALGGSNVETCLGGSEGVGFGWNNVGVYKLGLQWQTSPKSTWRFGYSHSDQPIDGDQVLFNVLATAVVEDHITAGYSYQTNRFGEINIEAMHAFHNSQTGVNPLDPSQEIRIDMKQFELGLGWSMDF